MRAINTAAVFLCCPVNWSSLFIYLFISPYFFRFSSLCIHFSYAVFFTAFFVSYLSLVYVPTSFPYNFIFLYLLVNLIYLLSPFMLLCSPFSYFIVLRTYVFICLSSICSPTFILLFQLVLKLLSCLLNICCVCLCFIFPISFSFI